MWESRSQGALSPGENGEPEGGDHVPRVQKVQAVVRTRERPSSYMLATRALSALVPYLREEAREADRDDLGGGG